MVYNNTSPLTTVLNNVCPLRHNLQTTRFFFSKVNDHDDFLLGAQDQRLGAEQDQPGGLTGTSSGKCQETETRIFQACHTPRQPLQNHPSRHLERRATPWSGRGNSRWTTSINGHSCLCQKCSQWLPAEKTGRGSPLNQPSCPPRRPNRSKDWNEPTEAIIIYW